MNPKALRFMTLGQAFLKAGIYLHVASVDCYKALVNTTWLVILKDDWVYFFLLHRTG